MRIYDKQSDVKMTLSLSILLKVVSGLHFIPRKIRIPMVLWLSSWLAEQEVKGSIPGLAATISEIGYLLLLCRDTAERSLKRRKSSNQPNNQPPYLHARRKRRLKLVGFLEKP